MQQLQLCAKLGHTPKQAAETVADAAARRAGAKQDDITVAVAGDGESRVNRREPCRGGHCRPCRLRQWDSARADMESAPTAVGVGVLDDPGVCGGDKLAGEQCSPLQATLESMRVI